MKTVMASSSKCFISLCFFTLFFKSSNGFSNTSFSFNNFGKYSNFDSILALYGDAKVVNGGSSLQLTHLLPSSAGRVIYRKPIKIYAGTPKKSVSISTYFTFLTSNVDRLAFVMFPFGYPLNLFDYNCSSGLLSDKKFKLLSVEFDVNEDQIGMNSSRFMSVKVMNLSFVSLGLNGDQKMQTWIDYEPGSRRLEVRLNKFGTKRPIDPSLFAQIGFDKLWPKNEVVFVGLSSFNGNSSKGCEINSWRFKASRALDWMHSQPLDPTITKFNQEHEKKVSNKESGCVIWIIGALILGIGIGCLGTFLVMFMFTICASQNRRSIMPEEFAVKSLQEYEHKKLKIVLDGASANEN